VSRYGSRKFIGFMAVLLSATGLVAFKLISDGVYSAVVIADITAYLAANAYQKRIEKGIA
jgi:hypothetical protein